jgi:ABC-type nitrate/sulfonate/bicarbonate transport system substrate-binding protein
MELFNIFALVCSHIFAASAGAGAYRYYMKRNPAAVEALAKAIKEASDKIEEKVKG